MKRRQERDLLMAKQRKEKADQTNAKKTQRERRISDMHAQYDGEIQSRLLAPTKAYEAQKISDVELDAAEHRRHSVGAHAAAMPMTGRDLKYGTGRATPSWMK
jgi:hypothetical protein